jgi:hypothetical protein
MAARHPATAGLGRRIQQFGLVIAAQALQMRRTCCGRSSRTSCRFHRSGQVGAEQQQLVGAQSMAARVATSSQARLKISPVGE